MPESTSAPSDQSKIKRIDPAAIPALFAAHRIRPQRGLWLKCGEARTELICGCLDGLLAVDARLRGVSSRSEAREKLLCLFESPSSAHGDEGGIATALEADGYDSQYIEGLSAGWETRPNKAMDYYAGLIGAHHFVYLPADHPKRLGCEDGMAALLECIRGGYESLLEI